MYSIAHGNPNAYNVITADRLDYDSTWNFMYAGYSIPDK